jgi:hypothetical protein
MELRLALEGGSSFPRGFLAFLVAPGCLVPLLLLQGGGGISAEEEDDGEQAGGGGAWGGGDLSMMTARGVLGWLSSGG